jgi:hypothetical protein
MRHNKPFRRNAADRELSESSARERASACTHNELIEIVQRHFS